MPPFGSQQEANFQSCKQMIESVLSQRGLDPGACRIESEDGPAWGIKQGSAEVYIFLQAQDRENFVQVVSPVLVPSPEALAEPRLMRKLLEANADELTGAAFGLRDGEVVMTADRPTTGLDRVELEDMIRRVAGYADHYDDMLYCEFGGSRSSEAE
jgi:hypothetical protein